MNIRIMMIVMLLVVALGPMVVMSATAATATRTSPYDCVEPGANFTVLSQQMTMGAWVR